MTSYAEDRVIRAARRSLRALAAVVMLAAGNGCSDSATAPRDEPITGSYALADVGGNDLPTVIYDGPYMVNGQRINVRIDVAGGSLTLERDRYTFHMQLLATIDGQVAPLPIEEEGGYTRNGDQITFHSDDTGIGSYSGEITRSGVAVTIDLMGDEHPPVYLFRR